MRLADLLEMPVLQKLAEANYKASGMPIGIIDAVDGSILVGFGWQDVCTMFHRVNPQTLARCRESDAYITDHLSEAEPCEYVCKNGLRDIGVAIVVRDQHVATLFLGQFFYEGESPDRGFFVNQARQLGLDETSYLAALDRVPAFSRGAVENILQYNQALARVISDLAERALRQAEQEQALRDADRRKTEFIAVLSHELRNPLAPIQNSLHLLEREAPRSDRARKALAIANRQMRNLARLLDDLLDVMRLSRGAPTLRRKPLELSQLVSVAIEDHRDLFSDGRLSLELHQPSEPVWVDGDPTRLSQVCGNLLRNALKFTNPGGHVSVDVDRVGDDATVRVRDDGIGIAGEVLARIFEPFVQADASLDRARGGLGLGLSLARTVVELHGGTIRASSAGEGEGAEFVLTLPVCPEPPGAGPEASHPNVSRRVLVVEDNEDMAETLRDVLESEGHEVHVALDGLRGVEAAHRVHPDVILCDIGLPGIDGYEVARRLRASGEAGVLIAVTGYASTDDVRRAAEAGFQHHVAKPADLATLSRLVGTALVVRN